MEINTNNPQSLPMTMEDELYIIVNDDCTWCYKPDPNSVFAAPPTGFLAAGRYTNTTPPTRYGPYTPNAVGSICYNAVTSGDCDCSEITATGHSITVTS
jgi:hypothetical protein